MIFFVVFLFLQTHNLYHFFLDFILYGGWVRIVIRHMMNMNLCIQSASKYFSLYGWLVKNPDHKLWLFGLRDLILYGWVIIGVFIQYFILTMTITIIFVFITLTFIKIRCFCVKGMENFLTLSASDAASQLQMY